MASKKEWRGLCEYPLTPEYEAGHVATFGDKADKFCPGCDRRIAWCECANKTAQDER